MMKRFSALLCVALTAGLLGGCQWWYSFWAPPDRAVATPYTGPSPRQLQHLDDAQLAMDRGDYEIALSIFREILAENPTIDTAYMGIGQIYMLQEDYESAEPAFARAARLSPRNFDAQYYHGLALQMLSRFVDAIRAYHRALTIQPNSYEANRNIATTYLQMDDPRSALAFAERAVQANPQSGPARANLGAVYERLGRHSDAVDHYLVAMEQLDQTGPLMMNLINVLAKEQRYREAAHTAENLVREDPSGPAYERLGWLYFRLGEYDRSIEAYRSSVQLDPRHWPAWTGVGVNALNAWLLSERADSESFREAQHAFRRSLQINPQQPRLVTLMSNYGL